MADVPGECGDGSGGAEASAGDDDLVFDILRRRLTDVCAPGGIPGSYPPPRATEHLGLAHSLDARLRESVLFSRALAANARLCATLPPFATEHHGARLAFASIAHDTDATAAASRSSSPRALCVRGYGGCVPSLPPSRAARLARAPPVPAAALPVALPVRATSARSLRDIHDRLTSHTCAPGALERAAREARAEDPTSLVVAPVLAYESPRLERLIRKIDVSRVSSAPPSLCASLERAAAGPREGLGARKRDRRDGGADCSLDERTSNRRERLLDESSPALADAPTRSAPAGPRDPEAVLNASFRVPRCNLRGASFDRGRAREEARVREAGANMLVPDVGAAGLGPKRSWSESAIGTLPRDFGPGALRFRTLASASPAPRETNEAADAKHASGGLGFRRDERTRRRASRSRIRETERVAKTRPSFDETNASGSRLASDPAFVPGANHVCEHAELAEFASAPDADALDTMAWTTWELGTGGPPDGFEGPTGSA